MRQVKSYMQSTMTQERLSHLMILHLIEIANSFVNYV